jgi:hypothetical protein
MTPEQETPWLPSREELPKMLKEEELNGDHAAWSVEQHLTKLERENRELVTALQGLLAICEPEDGVELRKRDQRAVAAARRALEGKRFSASARSAEPPARIG